MDTLNTGFIWEYDDNSFEEKNLLIDTLPEGFKYRVKKLKIIEKSDVKEEVKFQTQIQVNICDKDEAEKFIQMIKNKNDTDMKPTRKEFQRKGLQKEQTGPKKWNYYEDVCESKSVSTTFLKQRYFKTIEISGTHRDF